MRKCFKDSNYNTKNFILENPQGTGWTFGIFRAICSKKGKILLVMALQESNDFKGFLNNFKKIENFDYKLIEQHLIRAEEEAKKKSNRWDDHYKFIRENIHIIK